MRTWFALIPVLVACRAGAPITEDSGADTSTADTSHEDTDIDEQGQCAAALASIAPSDTATNVPADAEVTAAFTAPVAADAWSIAVAGATGATALSTDRLSATFVPDETLERDHAYTVTVEVCGATTSTSFRTAGAPLPVEQLAGRTYGLAYDDVRWVAPPGAALFGGMLDVFETLLLQVVQVDTAAETIHVALAVGDAARAQAACYPVHDYGSTEFSTNPVFQVGPTDVAFETDQGDVTLQDLYLEGTFAPDGSRLEDVEIIAEVDTRPIDAATGYEICAFVSCIDCADGVTSCLPVVLRADEAVWIEDRTLDLGYDPHTDPSCTP